MMKRTYSHRLGTGFLLLCIAGFYSAILSSRVGSRRKLPPVTTHVQKLYKTIYSHDDSSSLIGFELHSAAIRMGAELYKECSVIVRTMDPASDDYKTYCRDIVDELVGMYGEENLTVNIYDSFEAYSLVVDDRRIRSDADERLIAEHKIASFEAYYEDGDRLAFLTYYPEADNRYHERVGYSRCSM